MEFKEVIHRTIDNLKYDMEHAEHPEDKETAMCDLTELKDDLLALVDLI